MLSLELARACAPVPVRSRAALPALALLAALLAGALVAEPVIATDSCTAAPSAMTHWWSAESNALDIVGPHNGVLNGDTAYAAGMVGNAFSFDGAGDYVTLPLSADWDFGTASFTINAWFRSSMAGGYGNIIRYHNGGGTGGYWGLRLTPSGAVQLVIGDAAGYPAQSLISSDAAVNDGAWHFVSALRDAGAGELRLYVDGAVAATAVSDGGRNVVAAAGTYPAIGRVGNADIEYFNGLIDELQIFDRALSLAESQQIYNAASAGVCRPCSVDLGGALNWWRAENDAGDSVGDSHGTIVGDTTYAAGKVGQAFSFDGSGDYIEVSSGDAGNLGSEDFTVDFWMNSASAGEGDYLLGKSYPDIGQGWDIRLHNSSIYVVGVHGWAVNITSDPVIATDTWHHIALTASSSEVKLYIDSVPRGQTGRSAIGGTGNPFRIGWTSGYGGTAFQGLLDEIEFFDHALTAEEVAAVYNAGNSGECVAPPTTTTTTTVTSTTSSTTWVTVSISVTTSSSTTTMPPLACGVIVTGGAKPLASDCLGILQHAVAKDGCTPWALCICDVDASGQILASDALRCLNVAVGNPAFTLDCQCFPVTTSTLPF